MCRVPLTLRPLSTTADRPSRWSIPTSGGLVAGILLGVPATLVLTAAVVTQPAQVACTAVLVALCAGLYVAKSELGLVALWTLWLVGPGIRRGLALSEGYTSADALALAPFLATATLAGIAAMQTRLPRQLTIMLALALGGLTLGVPTGLLAPPALAFAFFAYGAAVCAAVLGYVEGRRSQRSALGIAFLAVLPVVAVYGIFQYFAPLTPWDDEWLNSVEFSSIGSPEEGRVRIFATMNSPGTLAAVLALGILAVLSARRLRPHHVAALLVLAVALALTFVRSAWISLVPALIVLALVNRVLGFLRVGIVLLAIVIAVPALAASGGTAGAVLERANTLGSVSEDGSGQARTATLLYRLPAALSSPIGLGLGSSGEPARLAGDQRALPLDNGYLSIIEQLGPAGALMFLFAVGYGVRNLVRVARRYDGQVRWRAGLHLTLIAFLIIQAYFGDIFYGVNGVVLWYLLGWSFGAERREGVA